MIPLLLSTRNPHKLEEFRAILGADLPLVGLDAIPDFGEIEETGDSFEANAVLKAVAASMHFGGFVLADDSGLEVDALGGEPGVRSARYAGEPANQEKNNLLLLEKLADVRGRKRSARFHCALAVARHGRCVAKFDGTVEGAIVRRPRGRAGFGYDPLFVPNGFRETFAQMEAERKNALSHRGRAIRAARPWLEKMSAARR